MAAGDVQALRAALSLPLECLGKVCCCAISRTPISALLAGLLTGNEAGQLALCPQPTHKQWELCLRLSKSCSRHVFSRLAHPESLILHLQVKPFGHPLGQLLWELQVLIRVAWTILADTAWASASFLTLTCQSFSTLVAISMMEAFEVRFLWSAAAISSSLPLDKCLFLHSHQGLVMVDLLNNFLNPLKLFLAVASDFTKSPWQWMEGVWRERSTADQLRWIWKKSAPKKTF